MKAAALLFAVATASCSPVGIDFPEETGAPPRPMPAGMQVVELEQDFADMRRGEGGAIATGSTVLDGQRCEIALPKASAWPDYVHTVSAADRAHIRTHELRHCTGQRHDRQEVSPGVFVIVWKP